mgnify:CR=1 FL=1
MTLTSRNPIDGNILCEFPETSQQDVERCLDRAVKAQYNLCKNSPSERAWKFKKAIKHLEQKSDEYAKLMALEMGKPIKQGREEIASCIKIFKYYAENSKSFLTSKEIEVANAEAHVRHEISSVSAYYV